MIYIDGTKLKGNAPRQKRTKDRAGFEKWLSEIEERRGKDKSYRQRRQSHEDRGSKDIRPGLQLSGSGNRGWFLSWQHKR